MRRYCDVSRVVGRTLCDTRIKDFDEMIDRVQALYRAISEHYDVPYDFPDAPELAAMTELCGSIEDAVVEFEKWAAEKTR